MPRSLSVENELKSSNPKFFLLLGIRITYLDGAEQKTALLPPCHVSREPLKSSLPASNYTERLQRPEHIPGGRFWITRVTGSWRLGLLLRDGVFSLDFLISLSSIWQMSKKWENMPAEELSSLKLVVDKQPEEKPTSSKITVKSAKWFKIDVPPRGKSPGMHKNTTSRHQSAGHLWAPPSSLGKNTFPFLWGFLLPQMHSMCPLELPILMWPHVPCDNWEVWWSSSDTRT